MKLIVDISDDAYERIQSLVEYSEHDIFGYSMRRIANGTPLKEWLSSFNTDSAPQCFNAVQELKKKV